MGYQIINNPPKAKPRAKNDKTIIAVDAKQFQRSDYQIKLHSYGRVESVLKTRIVAQVSGKIIALAENFENGGSVANDDTLIQIEPIDFTIAIKKARASYTEAKAALQEEKTRGKEAVTDWKRLGRKGKPSNLVARVPQLSAAKAKLSSALASLEKAELDLKRASIKAPFSGHIVNKQASLGQFITPGSVLSELFSNDSYRVRLPLSVTDLQWVNIDNQSSENASKVVFISPNNSSQAQLHGHLHQEEAELDKVTRQLFISANIDSDPSSNRIINGQFVNATILGKTLKQVYTVPSQLIDDQNQITLVKDNKLIQQTVNIVWRNEKISVIDDGLNDQDWVLTTTLGSDTKSLKVRLKNTSTSGKQP